MGFSHHPVKFLLFGLAKGVSLERTLTLGRQNLNLRREELGNLLGRFGHRLKASAIEEIAGSRYADRLLESLGGQVEALDMSGYEGATVVHDLNLPVPQELWGCYSCIVDGGTSQHIFDIPQALVNVMRMLRVGGHFVSMTVANNYLGHGLYQFSPELVYGVFNDATGFEIVDVILTASTRQGPWYRVPRLSKTGERIEIADAEPLLMLYLVRKIADRVPQRLTAYNIDYQKQWERAERNQSTQRPNRRGRAGPWLRRNLPGLFDAVQTGRWLTKHFAWHRQLSRIDETEYLPVPRATPPGNIFPLPRSRRAV